MLTAKERRVFLFIRGYIESNGEAPTIAEIGRHFQLASSATVHGILTSLVSEGLIRRIPNVARGIALCDLTAGPQASESRLAASPGLSHDQL